MAATYRYHKDSLDDIDEKGYSDHSDIDEMRIDGDGDGDCELSSTKNNFMNQVHQRRQSFSYSKHSENDSDDDNTLTPNNINIPLQIDTKNPYYFDDIHKKLLSPFASPHCHDMGILKREHSESILDPTPLKLERRHSADKVLSKACTKRINSVDYLNRMVISLRAKIASHKEDLKIAAELGQNLFISNAKKELLIDEYQVDMHKVKAMNEELKMAHKQLIQTNAIDAQHTKQLETDLHLEMSSSLNKTSKYQQECVHLREELKRTMSEIRHIQQLNDEQRIEIETLDTRNEQISRNAGETIDDLSQELAEEKDDHCNLKYKHGMMRNEYTKLKINYEKRGTQIKALKKTIHDQDVTILRITKGDNTTNHSKDTTDSVRKQEMKLLYRQIDNFKDEMEGISKHADLTKTYLKTTVNYLENIVLLQCEADINQIYTLCDNAREFLGITEAPPTPREKEIDYDIEPPMIPDDYYAEPHGSSDEDMDIAAPMEPTPPLKVSHIERIPIPIPTVQITPTPPPPCIPSDINHGDIPMISEHKPSMKIRHKAHNPPQSMPLPPPPPSPHNTSKSKVHSTGMMPAPFKTVQHVSVPSVPLSVHDAMVPCIPEVIIPKTKRFSSAITPPEMIQRMHIVAPNVPMDNGNIALLMPIERPLKCNVIGNAMLPETEEIPSMPVPSSVTQLPSVPIEQSTRKAKRHRLGLIPTPIKSVHNNIALPSPSSVRDAMVPSIPEVIIPKTKRFSSAITPLMIVQRTDIVAPNIPNDKNSIPIPIQRPLKCNVIGNAMIPGIQDDIHIAIVPPMPTPSIVATQLPCMPIQQGIRKQGKRHRFGVMPVAIVDEKPSVPSLPSSHSEATPYIPYPHVQQAEPKHRVKITASAMAPPMYTHTPIPKISTPHSAPIPHKSEGMKLSSIESGVQSHNVKKRKKKRQKTQKKKGDSMLEQKEHLTRFFSTYSDNKNWTEGGKENGVQKYILQFAEREPLNARMAFLYSMTLYLGQIVGVNKRCISHAFMLFKSVRAQIDTLCDEFALILQTLEHHNDDKLWKYVYSFLYNAAAYFKHIQRFVGTRTSVDNPRKYSRALKAGSRDFSNVHRDSTFRKLSGLSEVSAASGASSVDYNNYNNGDRDRIVYGNNNENTNTNMNEYKRNKNKKKRHKKIKVLRK